MTENEGLWPLCETCGAVPTRHYDYKDCEKHMQVVARAYNGGRENGGKQERAAVVAWLREQRIYGTDALLGQGFANVCGILADDIERGEHRCDGDKP